MSLLGCWYDLKSSLRLRGRNMWSFRLPGERRPISAIRFAILLALREDEFCLVDIEERLRRPFGTIWQPHRGTISNALKELEERGFVESHEATEGERGRKNFELTQRGREVLQKAFKGFSEAMEITSRFAEALSHDLSQFSEVNELIRECLSEPTPRHMFMMRMCIPHEKMLHDEQAVKTYHRFLKSELEQIERNLARRRQRKVRIKVE